jgi:hypothetical protein
MKDRYWIFKGTSNFCSELVMDDDCTFVKAKPEGFYDIVSTRDTIEGGIEVISVDKVRRLVGALKDKVNYHRQAYGLDIFPNSEVLTDESSRDNVAARMGRHMCDCFLQYIDESAKELGEL